jgi:hypothetical protein
MKIPFQFPKSLKPVIIESNRWVNGLWARISTQGVTPNLPEALSHKVVLCNRLAITVSLILIFPLVTYWGALDVFLLHLIAILCYLCTLLFNRLGWYHFASWWFVITLPLFNLIGAGLLTEGPASAVKVSFISMIILPILLFQLSETRKMVIGLAWVVP